MIKGLSDKRRLPRAGKIRLGIMIQEPGKRPYPKATEYFVVPEAVAAVGGERPKKLPIMFPVDEIDRLFPQQLKMYRTAGLFCAGDGQRARRWSDKGKLEEIACPCPFLESGDCSPSATLNFLLPDVPGIGVWQITTSNQRSIVSLNTSLEQFTRTFGGLRGIPFDLLLEPEHISRFDEKGGKMVRQTIHVLRLDTPHTLREIVEWRVKTGKPVEALMPASTEEDDEAADANGGDAPLAADGAEAIPTRPTTAHAARSDPAAPAEAAGLGGEEFDISMCFQAAKILGFPPSSYGEYLRRRYGVGADDLPPAALHQEADFWRKAQESPTASHAAKSVVLAVLRKGEQERMFS